VNRKFVFQFIAVTLKPSISDRRRNRMIQGLRAQEWMRLYC